MGGTMKSNFADRSGNLLTNVASGYYSETSPVAEDMGFRTATYNTAYNYVFEYTPVSGENGYCKFFNLTFDWKC
ncbi:MAG: hypothetical protein K6B65_02085 [Bacilli bacterium]|nr:hypothetical protein [Bacilli bacterium]